MKRIAIVGIETKKIKELKKIIEKQGFLFCEENPSLVVCYGGDGMFLIAERKFPGVLKILLKGSKLSHKGYSISLESFLKFYLKKEYGIEEIKKLRANFVGVFEQRRLVAVNDVVIRNSLPTEALRFKIKINGKKFGDVFIGDGIVVSTAYGSGGYFSSITKKNFKNGIGLALNNISTKEECLILKSNSIIEVEILRGPGVLVVDNNRDYINLEKGDKVIVNETEEIAKRVVLNQQLYK